MTPELKAHIHDVLKKQLASAESTLSGMKLLMQPRQEEVERLRALMAAWEAEAGLDKLEGK